MTSPSTPPSLPPTAAEPAPKQYKRRSWLLLSVSGVALVAGLGWFTLVLPETTQLPEVAPSEENEQAPPKAEPAPTLHGDRVLDGTVHDDLGNPIADALIRVTSLDEPDAAPREVRSEAAGRFRVENLPEHLLAIEVSAIGHDVTERAIQPGDPSALTFVLQRQGELLVTLRDTPGNPVAGAEVLLTGTGVWPAASCVVDDLGQCLFRALPFGQYQARARHEERVALPSPTVEITPGQRARVELTLRAGTQLSGLVLDSASKQPLSGAKIAVVDMTPGLPAIVAESTEDGAFVLRGLWPGMMRLDVTRDGYARESHELRLPAQKPLTIHLDGAVSIRGRVVDERGRAIRGATLSVATRDGLPPTVMLPQKTDATLGELGVTQGPVPRIPLAPDAAFTLGALAGTSDSGGAFHIAGLKPGSIVLRASHAGFAQAMLPLENLAPHSTREDVQLVLRDAGRVEGRIADDKGHGLQGVYVSALQAEHTEQSSLSNERGEFLLRDLLGDVTVQVQVEGREPLLCKVSVPSRGFAHCNLTISGELHELPIRVVDDYGLGLEGALVSVRSSGERRTFSQVTQRDGRALLRDLPAPPYRMRVDLAGYLPLLDEMVAQAAHDVRVTLRRAARLTGTVVDTLGSPVPQALISSDDEDVSTETDARGNFVLAYVSPGPLTLWAVHPSAGESPSRQVRARPGETLTDVRLVLPRRFTEEATQDDDEGKAPAARAPVDVEQESDKPAEQLSLEQRPHAVIVSGLLASGAAAKAGFKVGDVIAEVDAEPVLSVAHARGMLRDPANTVARVRLLRSRQTLNVRYRRPAR